MSLMMHIQKCSHVDILCHQRTTDTGGSLNKAIDWHCKQNERQPTMLELVPTDILERIFFYNFVDTKIVVNNFGGLYWQSGYSRI